MAKKRKRQRAGQAPDGFRGLSRGAWKVLVSAGLSNVEDVSKMLHAPNALATLLRWKGIGPNRAKEIVLWAWPGITRAEICRWAWPEYFRGRSLRFIEAEFQAWDRTKN
jgi:hypothetical protein